MSSRTPPPPDADADGREAGTPSVRRLGVRYRRQVAPADVGRRVSIRHLVDDPARGPVPSDVVGRLAAMDDELLLIVDRAGRLHVVDATRVIASRVVPAHPRLPAEPDLGTRTAPLPRQAARVLLLDGDRVLLVAHAPDATRRVWTAPGGGLDAGEDHAAAGRRELREELGVDVEIGPWVWHRRVVFPFRGLWLDQDERWYLATAPVVDAARAPLDDPGALRARWWPLAELATTGEILAPTALAEHLADLLRDGPPAAPRDVGR